MWRPLLRDVLPPAEVDALNAAVSAHSTLDNGTGTDGYKCRYKNFFQWEGPHGHAEVGAYTRPPLFSST